jgi:peptidoglycan/LPS O-acetylase OafA/YrhL
VAAFAVESFDFSRNIIQILAAIIADEYFRHAFTLSHQLQFYRVYPRNAIACPEFSRWYLAILRRKADLADFWHKR